MSALHIVSLCCSQTLNQIPHLPPAVTQRNAVTLASCVSAFVSTPSAIQLAVGSRTSSAVAYTVQTVTPHESFNPADQLTNNIALLRTTLPIEMNANVGVACLFFSVPIGPIPIQTIVFQVKTATFGNEQGNTDIATAGCASGANLCTQTVAPSTGCSVS